MSVTRHARTLAGAALLVVPWHHGAAQLPTPAQEPTAIVHAFWTAALTMRWADAVVFLDLGDFEAMRRRHIEAARVRPGREYTAADLMLRDPEMPREAAEYEVRRREKMRRQYPQRLFPAYFGIDSASQLERMPIEEVAVRWIQAQDPLWLMLERRRTQRCPTSPELDSIAVARRPVVYGSVPAGTDTAFVLFRPGWFPMSDFSVDGLDLQPPRIATLRRLPAGWRIRVSDDLLQGSGFLGMDDCPAR